MGREKHLTGLIVGGLEVEGVVIVDCDMGFLFSLRKEKRGERYDKNVVMKNRRNVLVFLNEGVNWNSMRIFISRTDSKDNAQG